MYVCKPSLFMPPSLKGAGGHLWVIHPSVRPSGVSISTSQISLRNLKKTPGWSLFIPAWPRDTICIYRCDD